MPKAKKSPNKRAKSPMASKKKTTTKFKEASNKKKNREITGLFLIFFGVLSVISLLSMFNLFGNRLTSSNFAVYPFVNILGSFGDFLLFCYVNTVGSKLSFIVAIGIIILGYKLIRGKDKKLLVLRAIFLWAVVFFVAIIFSIPSMKPLYNISYVDGGGIIGHSVINTVFKPFFQTKTFGPYLIMGFIVLLWIVIGTPISFNELFGSFEVKLFNFFNKVKDAFLRFFSLIIETGEEIGAKIAYKAPVIPNKTQKLADNSNATNDDEDYDKLNDILNKMNSTNSSTEKPKRKPSDTIEEENILDAEIIEEDEKVTDNFDFESPKEKSYDDSSEFENSYEVSDVEENIAEDLSSSSNNQDIIDSETNNKSAQETLDSNFDVSINTVTEEKEENVKITEINGVDVEDIKIKKDYTLPPVDLLGLRKIEKSISPEELRKNGIKLLDKLGNFKITGKIINIVPGPVITRYEIKLDEHIQVSKVAKFADDLAMALEAQSIIIQAPIPGKNAIGIDVPNSIREIVFFRELIDSDEFSKSKFILPFAIGKSVDGSNIVTGLEKLPHLLIAGQTGAGKSVGLNTIIMSLLYSQRPDQCKLILIDPKKVEFTIFKDIPHLLTPVVTEAEDALAALNWITAEMDDRYRILSKVGVRNIEGYNKKAENGEFPLSANIPEKYWKHMHYIVLIVDELADLMMLAGKEVEAAIQRIAQLARAVGIHLIVATQRPSVNVITGVIKANLPSRIAFKTPTVIDSRTILDSGGAEKLLGMGDMLFYKTGALAGAERVHGAFITDEEAEKIALFVSQQKREGDEPVEIPDKFKKKEEDAKENMGNLDNMDDKLKEAAILAIEQGELSATFLQRRLSVGFARAGKMVDELELLGIVGPKNGAKAREVLVGQDYMLSEEWDKFFG